MLAEMTPFRARRVKGTTSVDDARSIQVIIGGRDKAATVSVAKLSERFLCFVQHVSASKLVLVARPKSGEDIEQGSAYVGRGLAMLGDAHQTAARAKNQPGGARYTRHCPSESKTCIVVVGGSMITIRT